MSNTDLDAIIPMLLVTLAALATMIAEAFRKPDEHPPMGLLGLIYTYQHPALRRIAQRSP